MPELTTMVSDGVWWYRRGHGLRIRRSQVRILLGAPPAFIVFTWLRETGRPRACRDWSDCAGNMRAGRSVAGLTAHPEGHDGRWRSLPVGLLGPGQTVCDVPLVHVGIPTVDAGGLVPADLHSDRLADPGLLEVADPFVPR